MAEANTKHKELYLEENVKRIKELPHDLIRLCTSYEHLNEQFETNFTNAHGSFLAFQSQAMNSNEENSNNKDGQNMKDDLCLKHLQEMRECEQDMMMFQDEKLELLQENIDSLEAYIAKITKDLNEFKKILQPNMIKLPFAGKN
eukprot:CAMPEP_0197033052 /NCGR_PEP_ID=MMETSP1384-20130603/11563_1 /TAXON_ID=29189 /ORGANISM="Ammonia sp." /LENGTH=143 /DNA_ID=CAMNT_0042462799 /DNA_START=27 /DNA_END=458 /DNA_ORIENTATION=+